ncbi:MAG: DUF3662 domain-containing protein [Chloroflexi bacterium]|nr:DUF3662 domain-containing protein [Chloroflexota bacterium]
MKALTRFEEFLEGVVEGSFRRLFRGRIEPVDLARRIGRVMDDNKRVTWHRPLVPNQYRVVLAAADYQEVEGYAEALRRELEKFVAERATERGYGLLGPAAVVLLPEETLSPGTFQVHAAVVDDAAHHGSAAAGAPDAAGTPPVESDEFGQTRAMRPLEMPAGPTGFEVYYLTGEIAGKRLAWPVTGTRLTIGRGLDNDVVLEDASVSRHHAEIWREGGRLEVRDLGSTNGTWVNAGRVTAASVHAGDQVAFGAVHLEIARRVAD